MPVHPAAAVAPHNKPFPLVVFSHGLSGTRNTYSQMCQRLVSEGYVVLAVEHADGSGPCVIRDGKSWTFTKLDETVYVPFVVPLLEAGD
jgi:platelet-activating factor acetylhydrolase